MTSEEYDKLSDEEKLMLIAGLCNWSKLKLLKRGPDKGKVTGFPPGLQFDRPQRYVVYDYLGDLNAMHEAEKLFKTATQWMTFESYLSHIYCRDFGYGQAEVPLSHATATQRAKAFALTMTKGDK